MAALRVSAKLSDTQSELSQLRLVICDYIEELKLSSTDSISSLMLSSWLGALDCLDVNRL